MPTTKLHTSRVSLPGRPSHTTSPFRHDGARALACALWVWGFAAAAVAGAQAPSAPPSPAQTVPPAPVHIEPVQIAPDVELPSGDYVEVQVIIDTQGHARLDDPLHAGRLRTAIEAALLRSMFRPAQRNGKPVAARVRLRLGSATAPERRPRASPDTGPGAAAVAGEATTGSPTRAGADDAGQALLEYSATGRIKRRPPTARQLELTEMRDLPGAFGDPFRVIDALPGVVPALSGLPYVYVRGSPPAGTVYFYDDIQVPALFHLALGPAVVHPAMIGGIDFYPSVAPARYGRYTGGVLAGGPSLNPRLTAAGGELELRLIDVMGMAHVPLGGGSFTVAGRYGYPGLVLSLLSPDASLSYWDYQTRLVLPLSAHDRFELTWFGSFDRAGSKDASGQLNTVTLEFHRAEARLIRELGNFEFGTALQLGYERSEIESGLRVVSARIGPRLYALFHGEQGLRLRIGADFFGDVGRLSSPPGQDSVGIQIRVPLYADVAARSMSGAYAELHVPLRPELALDLGLRSDLWLTGSSPEVAADPRATLTWQLDPRLSWHVAAGLGHQPAVFLIPLPGIEDVGLNHGLQTAIQSETGVALKLPAKIELESQLYLQRLDNMIFPELALDQSADCDALSPSVADATPRCNSGFPRASAWAYGAEIFLHRAQTERLSGWLSYTLGWARARSREGEDFIPTFDVRHTLNLVLQYRIVGGLHAGARVHYHTGKMASMTFLRQRAIRYEQRLPGFFRADVQLAYAWRTSWAQLRLSLEWFNLTLSREPTDIVCRDGVDVGANPLQATPCRVNRAPALFFPNLGLRAQF